MDMAQFIDSALSDNGKVFVNCVFGRSRLKIIFNKVIFKMVIFKIVIFKIEPAGQRLAWLPT